jgi:hypothetical protein
VSVRERPEVEIDYGTYDPNVLSFRTAAAIASQNENTDVFVYRDTRGSASVHIEAKENLTMSFTYDPTSANPVSNVVFTFVADGIIYHAYGLNTQVSGENGQYKIVGTISDLLDLDNSVFDNNPLAKSAFSLIFSISGDVGSGKLAIGSGS